MNSADSYKPIADYGIIGNLRTAALVGRDGSIDWCCFPHLDSPSIFAAILDGRKGGRFRISPAGATMGSQRYIEHTNVLQTIFSTDGGQLTITDFMPLWGNINVRNGSDGPPEIYRIIGFEGGEMELEIEWSPRFDYARVEMAIERNVGGWSAIDGRSIMSLGGVTEGRVEDDGFGPALKAKLALRGNQQRIFVTRWQTCDAESNLGVALELLDKTVRTWRGWVQQKKLIEIRELAGRWMQMLIRSELTLKLLTHTDTGAIAAAATTSLPETLGGVRNWDYRYTWIRDASLTAQALISLGHETEAIDFLFWAKRVSGFRNRAWGIQIMYGLHGETDLKEESLPHLEGYRGSQPVRIGNEAAKQLQLDIYGEIMNAGYELVRHGYPLEPGHMFLLQAVADQACVIWQKPDHGIWEIRGLPRHYVHSKVMIWVALNRAIYLAERLGLPGKVDYWWRIRSRLYDQILELGYSREVGSFVQSFGSQDLDASNLLIPLHEFLPFDDPRVQGTIDRTIEHLTENDLVYRYRSSDNLPGKEGVFGLCTFWLVNALALSGRIDEAWRYFEAVATRANHLGLFAEQFDPATGEFLGNFPQAFTHLGLIESLLYLAYAEGKKVPEPMTPSRTV